MMKPHTSIYCFLKSRIKVHKGAFRKGRVFGIMHT